MDAKRKIKILFAINCMNIGGAPSVVYHQIKNISKKKFDPYLLTLYPSKKANFFDKLAPVLENKKIKQFKLKNRSIFDFKTIFRIFKHIKKEKFDVVYTHLFLSNLIVRIVAILARVPVIISFEHSFYYKKRKWQILADKFLSFFTTKIVVPSLEIARFTSDQENVPINKFSVIAYPVIVPPKENIDAKVLKKEFNISGDDFIVLNIGRFSEVKGQDCFLEVASKVVRKHNKIYFLLIGHGPLEDKLKEKLEALNLGNHCRIIVEPERAKEFFYIADVFVSTSFREGLPIVVLEAMKTGLPIIGFSIDAFKRLIKQNYNGLLVPLKDVNSLKKKIILLYNYENKRKEMSLNAARTGKMYNVEKNIRKLENLINEHVKRQEK